MRMAINKTAIAIAFAGLLSSSAHAWMDDWAPAFNCTPAEVEELPAEKVAFVNDASKLAEVVDDRHVRYGKEVMSLSMLAKQLTGLKHELQGPIYFTYKGELLDTLRKRLEEA